MPYRCAASAKLGSPLSLTPLLWHNNGSLDEVETFQRYGITVRCNSRDIRVILRRARNPYELRANRLMQHLKTIAGESEERATLILILRKTFAGAADRTALKAIIASDFYGKSSREAAEMLNVSVRQYHRYREKGFQAVADTVNDMQKASAPQRAAIRS